MPAAWIVWFLTSVFYGFQFFLRSAPNAMAQTLMDHFCIRADAFSLFLAAYYVPYALLQVPLGMALDAWGPKRLMRGGIVLCVVGVALLASAPTWVVASIGRGLIGVGGAISFIGGIRMNMLWFPPAYWAFSIGALSAVGKLGGALANRILPPWLMQGVTWTHMMHMMALFGLVLGVGLWLLARNGPQDTFEGHPLKLSTALDTLKQVLRSPIVWAMGVYGYSLYLVLTVFADGYSIKFLTTRLNIPFAQAGVLSSLVGAGSAVGSSVITLLSERAGQRKLFLQICALGTLLTSVWLFWGPIVPGWSMYALLGLLGFFSGGQVLAFVVAAESLPAKVTGLVSGVANGVMMLGGALHSLVIGVILEWSWRSHAGTTQALACPGGPHAVYSLQDYQWAFSSIVLFFLVAVWIGCVAPETHPRHPRRSLVPVTS